MAYYVKRYLDGSRRVFRVRDGIGDVFRSILGKLKSIIASAISFCISKLQGTGIGRRIANLLQVVLDRLVGSAKEATAAENGNGDLGASRKNFIEALKGLRKAKEAAEKSNLTPDVQIGIKTPIEDALRLMKDIASDFSLHGLLEKARSAGIATKPMSLAYSSSVNSGVPRRLALSYNPNVKEGSKFGRVKAMLRNKGIDHPLQKALERFNGASPRKNPLALGYESGTKNLTALQEKAGRESGFKNIVMRLVGKVSPNGAEPIKNSVMRVVSQSNPSHGMNSLASQITNVANGEISNIKSGLGGVNKLHLPENERKSFNQKINSVKRYTEAVIDVLRKLSGHTGEVIPIGTKLFENKVIYIPPKQSWYGYPWNMVRQKSLPF